MEESRRFLLPAGTNPHVQRQNHYSARGGEDHAQQLSHVQVLKTAGDNRLPSCCLSETQHQIAYASRPVKFAQGKTGKVLTFKVPLL